MNIMSEASINPPEQPMDTYTANPSEKMTSYLLFSSWVWNINHTEGARAMAPPRNKNMAATRWQPALFTRNLVVLISGSGLSEQQQVLHIPTIHRSKDRVANMSPAGRPNCRSRRSSTSTLEYHWKRQKIISVKTVSVRYSEGRRQPMGFHYLWIIDVASWISILLHTFGPQTVVHTDVPAVTIKGDQSGHTPLWDDSCHGQPSHWHTGKDEGKHVGGVNVPARHGHWCWQETRPRESSCWKVPEEVKGKKQLVGGQSFSLIIIHLFYSPPGIEPNIISRVLLNGPFTTGVS